MNLYDLIWANNTGAGRTIIVLVIALGTFGAHCAITHRRRYLKDETKWLERVRQKLQLAREARQSVSAEEQPAAGVSPMIDLTGLAEGIPADSIIGERLDPINRMNQAA